MKWPEESSRPIQRIRYFGDPRRDIWSLLHAFESPLYLRREVPTVRGANEYRQAAFALSLGREHFEAGDRAGLTARPLNLYYGALNFFKVLGYLLVAKTAERDWKRHGLDAKFDTSDIMGSTAVLKTEGVFRLGFEALSTGYAQVFGDLVDYEWTDNHVVPVVFGSFRAVQGQTIALRDVLARIPELQLHYYRAFRRRPLCLRGYVTYDDLHTSGWDVEYTLPRRFQGVLAPDLAHADAIVRPRSVSLANRRTTLEAEIRYSRRVACPNGSELIPMCATLEGDTYFVKPLLDTHLHEMVLHYIGLFLLSNAVRYRPDLWIRLITRRPAALGVIEKFMDAVSTKFPALMLNSLSLSHYFFFVPAVEPQVSRMLR
jgi:hypothetical protein